MNTKYGFTKEQAEFIAKTITELFGDREFIEAEWFEYKAHSFPLEINTRKLMPGTNGSAVHVFEYDHNPGVYGFNIGTNYGVTGAPDNWRCFSINADHYTVDFKYMEGDLVKCWRSYKALPDSEYAGEKSYSDELYRKFQNAMKESWKLR